MRAATTVVDAIVYPESDGEPMADNTKQFRWIVTIQGNLDALFRDRPDVFVAGDLLWYPVEGQPTIRRAPDAMVIFGRPKGDRGAYLQWREANIAPQIVFEVLSPVNTLAEMARKFEFYDLYGVKEYYLYDPDRNDLSGWEWRAGRLRAIDEMNGWVSPLLGMRFAPAIDALQLFYPNGDRFLSFNELHLLAANTRLRAESAESRAENAESRAESAESRAEQLAAKLRALGIDPDV